MLKKGLSILLQWLLRDSGGEETPEDTISPEPDNMMPDMPPAGESSIFWTVFGYLVLAGGIFLLIYYRRQIFAALRALFRKISGLLRRLFFRKGERPEVSDSSGDYRDDVEDLPREPAPESVKKRRPYDFRRWRRDYRTYRTMADSPDKVREGYRLAMLYLLLTRTPLSSADTPEEILAKAGSRLPPELFRQVTEFYRQVRYGDDDVSAPGMEHLANLLAECARMIA